MSKPQTKRAVKRTNNKRSAGAISRKVVLQSTVYALLIAAGVTVVVLQNHDKQTPSKPQSTSQTAPKPLQTDTKTDLGETPDLGQVAALINAERAKVGEQPLLNDDRLTQAAQARCQDMVNNNYYAHIAPSGLRWDTVIKQYVANSSQYSYGENLVETPTA